MELQELLKTHRSIRKYKKGAEVPLATIAEIVGESMAGGSSSGNLNTYSRGFEKIILTTCCDV